MDKDNNDQTPDQPIESGSPQYKNVLVVEDENFIGELYKRALEKAGYAVTVASDGKKALDQAVTNQFDIILLDLMVPTITGMDLLKKLRDPSLKPPLKSKIIITTNLEQKEEERAAIEKQADGYIVKANVTPKELVQFLQKLEV